MMDRVFPASRSYFSNSKLSYNIALVIETDEDGEEVRLVIYS